MRLGYFDTDEADECYGTKFGIVFLVIFDSIWNMRNQDLDHGNGNGIIFVICGSGKWLSITSLAFVKDLDNTYSKVRYFIIVFIWILINNLILHPLTPATL